jgi:F-type H+-transporting ATPase subunit gamma
MANILDIRRRIRSVINTRQITKAMKMVSAAKLRRAQERALAARPFAQMLSNVLKSIVSRTEIYDPETGEPKHPLLAQRPETNILLIVVTGDKGLAGAFNTNILKAATKFLASKSGKNLEIEAIGRKGRDFLRRRYRAAKPRTADSQDAVETSIIGEHVGVLGKVEFSFASELAQRVVERYSDEEIDAVYLLYNEFKSVIAQRLVVEKVLPIEHPGESTVTQSEGLDLAGKERAAEAAKGAGVTLRAPDTRDIDAAAAPCCPSTSAFRFSTR